MKIEVVQFSDGNYAIRFKHFLGSSEYLDLKNGKYKWSLGSKFIGDCFTDDLEYIKKIFLRLVDKPKVIKIKR